MPHRFPTTAALCFAAVCLIPSLAPAEDFQGTFSGEGMMMTLQPSQDRFFGTLIFNDEFYSIKADEEDGQLIGTFATDRGTFEFTADFRGSRLALETNSVTYFLRRTGQGADEETDEDLEPSKLAEAPPNEAPPVTSEVQSETLTPEVTETAEVLTEAEESDAEPESELESQPVSSTALASMNFEDGELPGKQEARPEKNSEASLEEARPREASPRETEPVESEESVETGIAPALVDGPVDDDLIGTWQRDLTARDDSLLADSELIELAADGTYSAAGTKSGIWKAEGSTLYFRDGTGGWQPYCRYKVVASSLLCTVDDESRQLWFRQ